MIKFQASERNRISFTLLCFLSPVYTHFFHVSSFEEHKPLNNFTSTASRYVHAISFSRGAIHLSMNTRSSVSLCCFLLLINPSRARYLICYLIRIFNQFFFILSVANALFRSAQIARTKPHGHHLDLNFAFPYHAHFSSSSILTFRHVFIFHLRRSFPHIITSLLLDYPEFIRLRHVQDLCSMNIAFVSLPQKVNMRDTPNFSHFDTHAFYMIKEMKNSVIYTQSARPLFAPCLFYLKRYRVFLSLLKARILVAKATYTDSATINKALNNIIKIE